MKARDFIECVHGYNDRLVDLHEIARRQSFFALASTGSKITAQKFNSDYWPLPGEVEEKNEKRKRLIETLKKERLNGK